MEYHGKLYGKSALGYFDTGSTTDDWDAMVAKIKQLEHQNSPTKTPTTHQAESTEGAIHVPESWLKSLLEIAQKCSEKMNNYTPDANCENNKIMLELSSLIGMAKSASALLKHNERSKF